MQTTRLPTFYMTRFYNMHTLLFAIQMLNRVIIWAPVPLVFFSIIFFLFILGLYYLTDLIPAISDIQCERAYASPQWIHK